MIYRLVMSRGAELEIDEAMVNEIFNSDEQLIAFRRNKKLEKIINKAHIVSITLDYESLEGLGEDRMLPEKQPNHKKVVDQLNNLAEKKPWSVG